MQCKNKKYKISQDTSYMLWKKNSAEAQATCNVKIAEERSYKMLVTCIKKTTGKGFYKVQGTEKGFHKYKSHAM